MPESVALLAEVSMATLAAIAMAILRHEVLVVGNVSVPVERLAFAFSDSALIHD